MLLGQIAKGVASKQGAFVGAAAGGIGGGAYLGDMAGFSIGEFFAEVKEDARGKRISREAIDRAQDTGSTYGKYIGAAVGGTLAFAASRKLATGFFTGMKKTEEQLRKDNAALSRALHINEMSD